MQFRFLTALLLLLASRLPAQYFTQGFDDMDALWSNGWDQHNSSGPQGITPYWYQGDPARFIAYDGGDTAYAAADYNSISGAGTISNWLFSPAVTFHNGEKITFRTRTVSNPQWPDRMQVRLSLAGTSTNVGTTSASVGDFSTLLLSINPTLNASGYPNSWTQYTIVISGLPAPTQGRFAFRYFVGGGGPGGSNSEYIGLDDVQYFLPPAGDLSLESAVPLPYTMVPQRQQGAGNYIAHILNYGSTSVTNLQVTAQLRNSQGTVVYTQSSPGAASLAPGARDTIAVPAATGLAPDTYTLRLFAGHGTTDGDHSNDTLIQRFDITPLTYAHDNGQVVGSIGLGGFIGGYVGQQFTIYQTDNVDSVWVHMERGYPGEPLAAVIWNMANGLPDQIVGSTDTLTYSGTGPADYMLPFQDGRLQLAPGDYALTMVEFDSILTIGLAAEAFTEGSTWMSWPTLPTPGHWTHVERFDLPQYHHAQMLRLHMSACDLVLDLQSTLESSPGALDGSAQVTAIGGTPPYTYQWSTGATTSNVSNLGASPVSVTVTDASGCQGTAFASMVLGNSEPHAPLVQLFPNPNHGLCRLEAHLPQATNLSLLLYSAQGQLILQQSIPAVQHLSHALDISAYPAGVYGLRLQAEGWEQSFKVVKW